MKVQMLLSALFLALLCAASGAEATNLRGGGRALFMQSDRRQLQGEKEVMEGATEAAKEMAGFVKDQVEEFLKEVKSVQADVDAWQAKWETLTVVNMPEFKGTVAKASTLLANANYRGQKTVKGIKTKLDQSLGLVQRGFYGPKADQKSKVAAIAMSRMTLAIGLKSAATEMEKIANSIQDTQLEFQEVHAKSEEYKELIDESIAGKTDDVQKQIKDWRTEAYASCAAVTTVCTLGSAGLFSGPCAAVCFGTAAGIVETNVGKLNEKLEARKKDVERMSAKFADIGAKALELGKSADRAFKNMSDAAASANTVNADFDADAPTNTMLVQFWEVATIPDMKSLQDILGEMISTWVNV